MTVLARIADHAGRNLAPVQATARYGERSTSDANAAGRVGANDAYGEVHDSSNDIEILGLGSRGRPVRSMPSSAFFAQHIGQNPDRRNAPLEQSLADVAYRDALDVGVAMDRQAPLSMAV